MRKKRFSPQEKKIKSYQKDRRNTYGEHDKASRKSIRKRKAIESRTYRRRSMQTLALVAAEHQDAEALDGIARGGWRKLADRPLAVHIEKTYDYGRQGLNQRPRGKNGLRIEAIKRLRQSGWDPDQI